MRKRSVAAVLPIAVIAASTGLYLHLWGGLGPGGLSPTESYRALFPPMLSKDFCPNGLTREKLLARLPRLFGRRVRWIMTRAGRAW